MHYVWIGKMLMEHNDQWIYRERVNFPGISEKRLQNRVFCTWENMLDKDKFSTTAEKVLHCKKGIYSV